MQWWYEKESSVDIVRKAIIENPGIGFNELVNSVDITRPTVSKAIKHLLSEDIIKKESDKYHKGKSRYFITERAIYEPDILGDMLFSLIIHYIDLVMLHESKIMFDEIKTMRDHELKDILNQSNTNFKDSDILEDMRSILNSYFTYTELKELIMDITKQYQINIEGIDEKNHKELIDIGIKLLLLNPRIGFLITPKRIYAYHLVIKHLLDRMVLVKLESKFPLEITISRLLDLLCTSFKMTPIDGNMEKEIIKIINLILDSDPEGIYNGYQKVFNVDVKDSIGEYSRFHADFVKNFYSLLALVD